MLSALPFESHFVVWWLWIIVAVALGLALLCRQVIKRKHLDRWIGSYIKTSRTRMVPSVRPGAGDEDAGPTLLFLAICDHFEPEWGRPSRRRSLERVRRWKRDYPAQFSRFSDSRGQVPQHTFFFPQDEYAPEYVDLLGDLCRSGYGDVDIHLHHDHDTPDRLRDKLESFRDVLFHRHELLRLDRRTGLPTYGFIHGNWALCNSRPDGRWCGVNEELTILLETGCYADFTYPSAPDVTQPPIINSIYYAFQKPGEPRSHESGPLARVGQMSPDDGLLMIQGPLLLDWSDRKWGILPRIENGDLHGRRPPTWPRFLRWESAGVHVSGRPDWKFIKLHTHGANDSNLEMLLGEPMQHFHEQLPRQFAKSRNKQFYYVTAWEMAQLVHQAESGYTVPDWSAISSESFVPVMQPS